jgi:Protein of unknown function (DUF2934)
MTRIVTSLFDKRREVDLVIEHLVQEFDIPRERVQVHALDATDAEARSPQDSDLEAPSDELTLPDEVLRGYAEGLHRGGILLAAWVDDDHVQRALDACREYGAKNAAAHSAEEHDGAGERDERTRVQAYLLWEQAGRPAGRDQEFWDQARRVASDEGTPARAPQEFAGETGAAPLPEQGKSPDR